MSLIEIIGLASAILTIVSIVTWKKHEKLRAFLFLIFLILAFLLGGVYLNKNKHANQHLNLESLLIEDQGTEEIYLGMNKEELKSLIAEKALNIYQHQGTPNSDDYPFIQILDKKSKPAIYLEFNQAQNQINELRFLSSSFYTYDKVRPGMTIKELFSIKGEMDLLSTGEMYPEEKFIPIDMNIEYLIESKNERGSVGRNFHLPAGGTNENGNYEYELTFGKKVEVTGITNDFDDQGIIAFIRVRGKE